MLVRRWKSEYRYDEEELRWLLKCVNALPQEEEDEESSIVTLTDEDGNEENFEILTIIEYEGKEYIALGDVNEKGSFIAGYYQETDEDSFEVLIIEDEEEYHKICTLIEDVLNGYD